jgi:FkbM family methyltransferase
MSTKAAPECAQVVTQLLVQHDLHPVLIDIGASGTPRDIWDLVARHSTLIGFDPDLREMHEQTGTGFFRSVIVNEAVTAEKDKDRVTFFLTRSPFCSSTLEPDLKAQSDYSIVDSFHVERSVEVKATTLDAVLSRLQVDRVDWFKVDSQGIDLRLFNSLSPAVRDRVLCVEIEPGLIAGYKGEDVFTDAHRNLIDQGFWLSDVKVCGATRIRQSSIKRLQKVRPDIGVEAVANRCRTAPGWVEATYLRSIDHLSLRRASVDEYVLLWAFALIARQWGFALDVALACETACGNVETSTAMAAPLIQWFTQPSARPARARRWMAAAVPVPVKKWIKYQLARGLNA